MKILLACEESQAVTKAFRSKGLNAFSCDILPCSGGHPEWHIQGDVLPLLREYWDLVIAFPPCTDLAVSGARYFAQKQADGRQQRSINFFLQFTKLKCPWGIENPIGIMSRHYRKPDQIIQPFQFGHPESKATCLWLNRLPKLKPTKQATAKRFKLVKGKQVPIWDNQTESGQNNLPPTEDRAKLRSKTYQGIADAMAEQWSAFLLSPAPINYTLFPD